VCFRFQRTAAWIVLLVVLCAYSNAWLFKQSLCGGEEYSILGSICCNGTIHPRLPSVTCCGTEVYYTKIYEKCVDGKVVKLKIDRYNAAP
ncbi:hypothetical protein LSAT2_006303, partial [Lamellibrachia satsuma]